MDQTNELLAELTSQYNKFKFHRTVLVLCVLYFGYTYVVDFPTGSSLYRIIMGGILIAIALLAFYAHQKMRELQKQVKMKI
ncbi:hypothetical protein [Anaerotignum propionicum]|jgi:uncharacterized membrane protein (DUF485 family)|uniref:hypothetical protein n=1 Tax=Anaerotignum propionicum TaxID=28446 RepID=UPI002896EECE|nr:hypothetical protein [Anaerotignum propionicum]